MSEKLIKISRGFVHCLVAEDFSRATTYFDATMKSALPPQKLAAVWHQLVASYGPADKRSALEPREIQEVNGHTVIILPFSFANTKVDLQVTVSKQDQISGFFIRPSSTTDDAKQYKEATYTQKGKFKDESVKIGEGPWQLDGRLSLPSGKGPFPCVILLHGSGPHDKDETIGPNKPFRDLAHGLASNGIAVLCYEKRTKQHQAKLSAEALRSFTVKEETLDDALAAHNLLKRRPDIDGKNIFVLGHSLGGMLIPRLAKLDADLRGFICMAGSNGRLDEAIVRQTEYIASLSPKNSTAQEGAKLAEIKKEAAKISALKKSDIESGGMILGASPAYWLDLQEHDPLVDIRDIDRPILFLQGGRDYQVTTDGDFKRWQKTIAESGKDNLCQFKLYPALNHLFIKGTGPCTPQEYFDKPGHIDEQVISDIAAWIKKRLDSSAR